MDENPPARMDEGLCMDEGSQPRTFKMAKVKLELDDLDPDGLAGKGDAVKTAMTGNANFPDAATLLAKLNTDNAAAKAKIIAQKNAAKAATQATLDRDAALVPVRQDLVDIGGHVQSVSHGNPVVIESAGLGVSAPTHNPVGKLGQVQNLSLSVGDKPGEADAHWDALSTRNTYEQHLCTSDPAVETNWKHYSTTGASKTTFAGQASGTRIWSRVRANASKPENNGPWSQPATIIVP
jgi:hypothetical protein